VVNPNTSEEITGAIAAAAVRAVSSTTDLTVVSAPFGPRYIATRADVAVAAHAALVALATHVPGHDGAVLAAFADPGLLAARELLPVPVVGMAEAAMLTACLLGGRFSVLTLHPRVVPLIRELAGTLGLAPRLASVRVAERSPVEVARSPRILLDALTRAGRAAVDGDGADVLVLGGAPLAALDRPLARRLGVPVLDGVGCAVRHAELLVGLAAARPRAGSFGPPPARDVVGIDPALARLFRSAAAPRATRSPRPRVSRPARARRRAAPGAARRVARP
jgi:Asp/Glu/hydantoin racemase